MPQRWILVFSTTSDTMQAEALCREAGCDGLLIRKPKGLVGNCALALQLDAKQLHAALELLRMRQIIPAASFADTAPDRWESPESQ